MIVLCRKAALTLVTVFSHDLNVKKVTDIHAVYELVYAYRKTWVGKTMRTLFVQSSTALASAHSVVAAPGISLGGVLVVGLLAVVGRQASAYDTPALGFQPDASDSPSVTVSVQSGRLRKL